MKSLLSIFIMIALLASEGRAQIQPMPKKTAPDVDTPATPQAAQTPAPAQEAPVQPSTPNPRRRRGLVHEISGQGYGKAGCGLGSILFGEDPGPVQIVASLTNGLGFHQTFAISSGTSNCAPEGPQVTAATTFIESNRYSLENDIARGSGETLTTFVNLIGCTQTEVVSNYLQKSYPAIFSSAPSPQKVYESIRSSLQSDAKTQRACPI